MRTAVAAAAALMLLSIVTFCPLMACPVAAHPEHHCGHEAPSHSIPCPAKTAQDCPYLLLEKGKASPAGAATAVVAMLVSLLPAPEAAGLLADGAEGRLVDSSGLFLRNRVLLI